MAVFLSYCITLFRLNLCWKVCGHVSTNPFAITLKRFGKSCLNSVSWHPVDLWWHKTLYIVKWKPEADVACLLFGICFQLALAFTMIHTGLKGKFVWHRHHIKLCEMAVATHLHVHTAFRDGKNKHPVSYFTSPLPPGAKLKMTPTN